MSNFFAFLSEQWILACSFLTFAFLFLYTESVKSGKKISNSSLVTMMNNKEAVLVDVREGADYAIGHIFGAVNIPHTKMPTRISELEKTMIELALSHTNGRKRDASVLLGWGRNTLTRKLQEYDLESG